MATQRKRRTVATKKNETVQVNTTGGAVRISQPTVGRAPTKRDKAAVVVDVVAAPAEGFIGFLKEYAVVGLAIGFIVGQQAQAVIKSLVSTFIDPLVNVWFGQNLSSRTSTLHHHGVPVLIPWGQFVYTLLDFFAVLIVVYAAVRMLRLDAFTKKVDAKDAKK